MLDNVILRLVVHYFATFLFFKGLFLLFPEIFTYIAEEKARSGSTALSFPQFAADPSLILVESDLYHPKTFGPVTLSLLFSFLFALPVTWVYRWTRSRDQYNQAFAQTLLVVPIAIALVVFLVKDSIALAFSLAGIVAAVRFRTALNEPMDATYMFIVIGIGLSAGIHLGTVAILASIAFNAVVLGVWRMNYGAEPAVLSGFRVVRPVKEGSLPGVGGEQASMVTRPYSARLMIHTTRIRAAQRAAIALLATYAKHWRQVRTVKQQDGTAILEFEVRLKKTTDAAAFVGALESSTESHAAKVELEKQGSTESRKEQ